VGFCIRVNTATCLQFDQKRNLVALFGRENVLFLRNEDLLPVIVDKQGGVLDHPSNFTLVLIALSSTLKVVTKYNDKEGMKSVCKQTRSSSYALSGRREIFPETRQLIYIRFRKECMFDVMA
jgi:hypothetical protein